MPIDLTDVFAGEAAAFVMGVAFSGAALLAMRVRNQRRINKALRERDVGSRFANISYTTYQWTNDDKKKCTQRLRPYNGKFDLAMVFNGNAQKRYLEYIDKAAALARENPDKPNVLDHLEEAVIACNSDPYHRVVGIFSKIDAKEVRKDIIRDLNIGLSVDIQQNAHSYPRLFDGVDFDNKRGTGLYPMIVAERDANHKQIKILLLREYDLVPGNVADNEDDVLVRVSSGKYRHVPDHDHMLRWRTNRNMIDRLTADKKFHEEVAIPIGIPPVLHVATPDQRAKMGILPPPAFVN